MSEIQSMNHDGCTAPWLTKYSYWEVNLGKIAAHLFCSHILQDGVLAVAAESGLSTEIVSEQKPVVVVYVGIGAKGNLAQASEA